MRQVGLRLRFRQSCALATLVAPRRQRGHTVVDATHSRMFSDEEEAEKLEPRVPRERARSCATYRPLRNFPVSVATRCMPIPRAGLTHRTLRSEILRPAALSSCTASSPVPARAYHRDRQVV